MKEGAVMLILYGHIICHSLFLDKKDIVLWIVNIVK